jgi:hypothetical protein
MTVRERTWDAGSNKTVERALDLRIAADGTVALISAMGAPERAARYKLW